MTFQELDKAGLVKDLLRIFRHGARGPYPPAIKADCRMFVRMLLQGMREKKTRKVVKPRASKPMRHRKVLHAR